MANHDDNARSLLFLDDILAAREEDEAVIEDFYEASTDVEDEEVGSRSDYSADEEEDEPDDGIPPREDQDDGVPPKEEQDDGRAGERPLSRPPK